MYLLSHLVDILTCYSHFKIDHPANTQLSLHLSNQSMFSQSLAGTKFAWRPDQDHVSELSRSLSFVCSLVVSLLHRIARCSLRWSCLVSLVCVSLSCASCLQQHHLFDWGFEGLGDIGEHLLSLRSLSLSRLED